MPACQRHAPADASCTPRLASNRGHPALPRLPAQPGCTRGGARTRRSLGAGCPAWGWPARDCSTGRLRSLPAEHRALTEHYALTELDGGKDHGHDFGQDHRQAPCTRCRFSHRHGCLSIRSTRWVRYATAALAGRCPFALQEPPADPGWQCLLHAPVAAATGATHLLLVGQRENALP
jgi:hypothetical protein